MSIRLSVRMIGTELYTDYLSDFLIDSSGKDCGNNSTDNTSDSGIIETKVRQKWKPLQLVNSECGSKVTMILMTT
jgi:hypothetical protein